MTTRIVLIRHGQTAWNREARFRGQSDVPLESFGLKQARATAEYVASRWPISAIYASPLKRTMKTAHLIAQAQEMAAEPMDALIDIDFGKLQGLLAAEAERHYPDIFQAWVEAPHTVSFPDAESLDIVRQRVTDALTKLNTRHTAQTIDETGNSRSYRRADYRPKLCNRTVI